MAHHSKSPDTQQKILAAARQEFIAHGKAGARMQAIANRAEVNKALLHYYFRSKDLLYKETMQDILNNVWGNIRKEITQHATSNDLRTLIHTITATYIKTIAENIDFIRLIIREIADGGNVLRELSGVLQKALGDMPQTVLGVIETNKANGVIRDIDPAHFIINIMSMSAGTFAARFFFSILGQQLAWPAQFDEQFIQSRIEEITETVCTGIFIRRNPA